MAVKGGLIRILDDKDEPLSKRLKIADNVFKSLDLPIPNRESFLLQWLTKIAKDEKDVWPLLLDWLTSQRLQELQIIGVTRDDVRKLMKMLTKSLQKCEDNLNLVIDCGVAIVKNKNFYLFFKHELNVYCKMVSHLLEKITDPGILCSFLQCEQLFNRSITTADEFYQLFFENLFSTIGDTLARFSNNPEIFLAFSKLLERCVFQRNYETFNNHFNNLFGGTESDCSQLPQVLLQNLQNLNSDNAKFVIKLIFYSYCSSYANNFKVIYQFFGVLTEMLSFTTADYFGLSKLSEDKFESRQLTFSTCILAELCEILTRKNVQLSCEINKVPFSDFVTNLITTLVVSSVVHDDNVYEILCHFLTLDPLSVEKILDKIVVFAILSPEKSKSYEKFMVHLLQVFQKLNRITNLFSKMLSSIGSALKDEFTFEECKLKFTGVCTKSDVEFSTRDALSENILNCLTQCVTLLPHRQYINLFKCFLHYLKEIVGHHERTNFEGNQIFLVELIGMLLCNLLSSVRVAEHTVSSVTVENFMKGMTELEGTLGTFGKILVNSEHNQTLMRTYLNICHTWGELYITMGYYSINNEVTIKKHLDGDLSASNITYLHSYLTGDVWSLISQRITNFGEKACKEIMLKLCVQKLKAMLLFEDNIVEDVVLSIRTAVLSSVEDNWKNLVYEPFVLQKILSNSDCMARISELILEDVIQTQKFDQLNLLYESDALINALYYTCLKKINRALGKKNKSRLSQKVFSSLSEDFLLNDSNREFMDFFDDNSSGVVGAKETVISEYLDLLKVLPTVSCGNQEILIVFLIAVFVDLKSCNNENLKEKLENMVLYLIKNCNCSFKILNKLNAIKTITSKFLQYDEIVALIFKKSFKIVIDLDAAWEVCQFLFEGNHIACVVSLLETANKQKKSKAWTENKSLLIEFTKKIYAQSFEAVKTSNGSVEFIELFDVVLRDSLQNCSQEDLSDMIKFAKIYLEWITQNTFDDKVQRGVMLFLTTLIRNRTKLEANEDVAGVAWKCCKKLQAMETCREEYAKLMVLIFEQMQLEQFEKVVNSLIKSLKKSLENQKLIKYIENMRLFQNIANGELSQKKSSCLQNLLQAFLVETLSGYLSLSDAKPENREIVYQEVVKLEVNIIKNVHMFMQSPLRESVFFTISTLNLDNTLEFSSAFVQSVTLMESLLKFRKLLTMDYLPSFLQYYRHLLRKLCCKSNADMEISEQTTQIVLDCAYKFEKLTIKITNCGKDLSRIAHYLIADILEQFEKISLITGVKIHLTNCLNFLIALCDDNSIAYLKRVLSIASTERFKIIYQNYVKYYKFNGKI